MDLKCKTLGWLPNMTPPTSPNGIRFVPENSAKGLYSFEFKVSDEYVRSKTGILTILQALTSFIALVVSASSRTHQYEVSNLVVYVAPKATFLFVLMYSFCFFYVDLLVILAATLSDFDVQTIEQSPFYMFITLSAVVFNLSASIAIFATYPQTTLNLVIASTALAAAIIYAARCAMISMKLIRLHRLVA